MPSTVEQYFDKVEVFDGSSFTDRTLEEQSPAGTAFAMISLGFCEMATAFTLIFVVFFNGEDGIQTDRMVGPEPFGVSFGPQIEVYYLIL